MASQRRQTQTTATDLIIAHNAGREPERLAIKYAKMRASAFAFLRGTAHLFHRRMADAGIAPVGPPAWSSGDLHLENYGTYSGDNGLVYFDVNDFDEALLAPAPWDILRLATSLLIAPPTLTLKRADTAKLAKQMLEAYCETLLTGKARWVERRIAGGLIGELMRGLRRRDPVAFLDDRTKLMKGVRSLKIDGSRALPVTAKELQELRHWLPSQAIGAGETAAFYLIDAARRVAGVASLGTPRYALLIAGAGGPAGNRVLELKSANPSATMAFSPFKQPTWSDDAERVATLQTRCQAIPPGLLRPVRFKGAPFILRELQPSEDRLDLAAALRQVAVFGDALATMAALSAWAQLRSSGRQGAATADDLIAFAADKAVSTRLMVVAKSLEEAVLADWREYSTAYDAGRFNPPA